MKFTYWVYFKAETATGIGEHTRVTVADQPIEFASDIEKLQLWAAKEVGADQAMVISWTPLVGEVRPEDNG